MAIDNKLAWLAGSEFSSLLVYLIVLFFCLVLGYWVWDKYGRGRPKKAPLESEKPLDELDAIEAESADQADLAQAVKAETEQAEPQLNQQPQQGVETVHETGATQEARLSGVPVQLDLLGFSTKQK